MMHRQWTAVGLLCAMVMSVLCCRMALGSGMLIPKDESVPPLAIKHQRVDIRIKDGAASVKVEQVFKNSVNRDLEAVYVFPLPDNAAISEFAMYINGKRVSGELVEKDKARSIYEDIVRRMRDPGLLEHMSGNLFRVSVYPVPKNGEQRIELAYAETLEFEAGLYRFVYPLKTSEKASSTLDDFTVTAKLLSAVPIKNVYSPSHKVGISRKGEYEATIGFEQDKGALDRDFVLYYGTSQKAFGLNLLTHAVEGQDGFFMLMLAPSVEPPRQAIVRRDVTFAFDTSGSMSGEKIRQAREALKYCVNRLNKDDRFNIVRFSTDVEKFKDGMTPVTDANVKAALEFVEKFEAQGGTAISDALVAALGTELGGEDRPKVIVFLTDGKPTVGVTDVAEILENLKKRVAKDTRIFVFGVGDDVNTRLLDRMSGEHGGVSQYVKPEEDIEVRVSSFYEKVSRPVLDRPKLEIEKIAVKDMHPRELPDLFAGEQLTVFGRYKDGGHVAIRLKGEVNGKEQEYVFEGTFQEKNAENEFIPRLWATRRVGYLLDQIRLHGEERELKDEVVRLGREYGIMTPYTSYLVLESDKDYETHGITKAQVEGRRKGGWGGGREEAERSAAREWAAAPARAALRAGTAAPAPAAVPIFGEADAFAKSVGANGAAMAAPEEKSVGEYLKADSGRQAVDLSEAIQRYRASDRADTQPSASVRYVGRKIFYLIEGVWTDRDYRKDMTERRVKYGSDEYFKLVGDRPELRKYLALGEKVTVCLDDKTALVVE